MYLSYDRVFHCKTVSLIFVSRRASGNLFVWNGVWTVKAVVVRSGNFKETFGSVHPTVVN